MRMIRSMTNRYRKTRLYNVGETPVKTKWVVAGAIVFCLSVVLGVRQFIEVNQDRVADNEAATDMNRYTSAFADYRQCLTSVNSRNELRSAFQRDYVFFDAVLDRLAEKGSTEETLLPLYLAVDQLYIDLDASYVARTPDECPEPIPPEGVDRFSVEESPNER